MYATYLQPFLLQNETDLDAGIITIQRNILIFIQGKLSVAWDLVWSVSNRNTQTQSANPAAGAPQLSWFLFSDVWGSAMNLLQASSRADANHSTLTTPPQNKDAAASEFPSTPAFPTPQLHQ